MDRDFGGNVETIERQLGHLPGGVAGIEGDAPIVRGKSDRGRAGAFGVDGHEVMKLESLVEGGQPVKAVRPWRPDGQPQVNL
jgi:hypothetical protein